MECCYNNRRNVFITLYSATALALIYVIVAILFATKNNQIATHPTAAGFAAIWSMLCMIGVLILGYVVLGKYKSPIGVGALLGASGMFSAMQLALFAIFAGRAQVETDGKTKEANSAMAVFSFFLVIAWTFFTIFLFLFRKGALEDNDNAPHAEEAL